MKRSKRKYIFLIITLIFLSFVYNEPRSFSLNSNNIDIFHTNTENLSAGTPLPAVIDGDDLTLTLQYSPYIANHDVTVDGVKLSVDPGVEILFVENASLYVKGQLVMHGTENNVITLRAADNNNSWGVISLFETTGPSNLKYVNISGCTHGVDLERDKAAISALNADIIIENVEFSDVDAPIFLNHCNNSVVRNCLLDAYLSGVYLSINNGSGNIENCEFIGSNIENVDAINFINSEGTIANNFFHDFEGINCNAINITGLAQNIQINNNNIKNISSIAIFLDTGVEAIIKKNLIESCDIGIAGNESSIITVKNNTFYKTNISFFSSGSTFNIENCIVDDSNLPVISEGNSNITISYTLCNSELLSGYGNLFDDPLFMMPIFNDFNLKAESPAIDAGNPLGPLDPDGTRADMGAFYFHQWDIKLVITEIHYYPVFNGSENKDLEFIEIYNSGDEIIVMDGYNFSSGIDFEFPDNSQILPGEYIVIAKKAILYNNPDYKTFEWTSGDLNNLTDHLKLQTSSGYVIDEVEYTSLAPWKTPPSGENYSIELIDPALDNSDPDNWRISFIIGGSPGGDGERPLIENLFINEFLADNDSGHDDEYGDYDDWIEIYNASDVSINMAGLYLSDNPDQPDQYLISDGFPESTIIDPGGFIVFWADNQSEQGPLHLNFSLRSKGEQIVLSQYFENNFEFLDTYLFSEQLVDVSFGRFPDASSNWTTMFVSTPGLSNIYTEPSLIDNLYINEISSWNDGIVPDEYGEYEPWIELYYSGGMITNLANLYLTDDPDNLTKWQIAPSNPSETIMIPGDYMMFWADREVYEGSFHSNITLNPLGGYLAVVQMYESNPVIIDEIVYEAHSPGSSVGRYPDGSQNIIIMLLPTPGSGNLDNEIVSITGLFINEIMSSNTSYLEDDHNEFDDWIEIYNSGSISFDLAGLYLTDDLDDPYKWKFPSNNPQTTTIMPSGYLLVWADNQISQGGLHAGFKLSSSGEDLYLLKNSAESPDIIDSFSFSSMYPNTTIGRYPDGSDNLEIFHIPTPLSPNIKSNPTQITSLFINELMASNNNGLKDNLNEFEDWIELYNGGNEAINVGGLFFSDDMENPELWQIPVNHPDSTRILPGDYLILYADNQPKQGILHLGIKLSSLGEQIVISQPVNNVLFEIERVAYGVQQENVSFARYADASDSWYYMAQSTPGWSNTSVPEPIIKDIYINEILIDNLTGIQDAYGERNSWIEIYNAGLIPVNLSGLFISNNNNFPLLWQIPSTDENNLIILPGDFQILWADNEPNQGLNHVRFNLDKNGGEISLTQTTGQGQNLINSISYPQQESDYSYGRKNDGGNIWDSFSKPSPGAQNFLSGLSENRAFFINEAMSSNNFSIQDNFDEYDDWIELYNAGSEPIDIGGYYISDDLMAPLKHKIPETNPNLTTIPSKGYLLLWADNNPDQGVLHMAFKLGKTGEDLIISQVVNLETLIVDVFNIPALDSDVSYGRFPDGEDDFFNFTISTPGQPNSGSGIPGPNTLFINEFMAWNGSTYPNENNDYKDWIEIYNAGTSAIDLGGFYLSNDFSNLTKHQIPSNHPELTTVEPNGFIVFRADENIELGPQHLNFRLSRLEDNIVLSWLVSGNIKILDSKSFGPQNIDISLGRSRDGGSNWKYFRTSTPGLSNEIVSSINVEAYDKDVVKVYPNPFNDQLTIRINVENQETASIDIYDLNGKYLKGLLDVGKMLIPGSNEFYWDGCDSMGNKMISGMYYCKINTKSYSKIIKIIMIN